MSKNAAESVLFAFGKSLALDWHIEVYFC